MPSHVPGNTVPRRLGAILDASVVIAALGTIPVLVAQEEGLRTPLVSVADWLLWSVFAADYALRLYCAEDRPRYARQEWICAVVVVLSFPLLPDLFEIVRLARLSRIPRVFRLLRLVAVTTRGLDAAKVILGRSAVLYTGSIVGFLLLASAALLTLVEPPPLRSDFAGAIWWAIVTVTTVGYGDVVPVTTAGRAVAVALMLAGIGFVSTLGASIVAYFLADEERSDLVQLRRQLDRIEQMLVTLTRDTVPKDAVDRVETAPMPNRSEAPTARPR